MKPSAQPLIDGTKPIKEPHISPGSEHNYNLYIGHIKDALGQRKLSGIKPYDIQAFYAAHAGKSKSAYNYYSIVFRAVFRIAEKKRGHPAQSDGQRGVTGN